MMESNNNRPWKNKLNHVVSSCQQEIKRTKSIGTRMITASKANTELKSAYEELGRLAYHALRSGLIEWGNSEVLKIVEKIQLKEKGLRSLEKQVTRLKKTPSSETKGDEL